MCTQKRTFDHLINRNGIPADLMMSVLHLCSCEFFSDLRGRSLWGPLLHAQRLPVRLRGFVWISSGFWFCDSSEIELKSSRFWCLSPRHLVASNLGKYKTIYLLFAAKLSLFLNLLSWRLGHLCAELYRHLSCDIRAIVVMVDFVITHLSILLFTICYCFHPSHIFVYHIL